MKPLQWMIALAAIMYGTWSAKSMARETCAQHLSAADALVHVPVTLVSGRVYVDAAVNGRGPYRFAVDTGASGVGRVDASLVKALGLPVGRGATSSDALTTSTVDTTQLNTLTLGGLTRRNVEVITRDYRSRVSKEAAFDGILARDFFADGVLVIDYRRRELWFGRSWHVATDDAQALPYERAFRVPVTIDGRSFEAQLDTGADVELVVPKALWPQLTDAPLASAGQASLTNGKVGTERGVLHGPVRVGALTLSDVNARVIEGFPEVVLGSAALRNARIMIDPRSRALAVCP